MQRQRNHVFGRLPFDKFGALIRDPEQTLLSRVVEGYLSKIFVSLNPSALMSGRMVYYSDIFKKKNFIRF